MSRQLMVEVVFSTFSVLMFQSHAIADGPGFGAPATSGISNGNGRASNAVQPGAADRQRLAGYNQNLQRYYPVVPGWPALVEMHQKK